jgi:surface protein
MFQRCMNVRQINMKGWDTSKVRSMTGMFSNCYGLDTLDVSGFRTDNVEDMSWMFAECNLTSLDLSHFNTSKVRDMSAMFNWCSQFTSLDVSGFNTSRVVDMHSMFNNCSGLTSLNVTNFDTSNAHNMSWMFANCTGLTSLDVSSFRVDSVEYITSMFQGCTSLERIYCSPETEWAGSFWNIRNYDDVFKDCVNLAGYCEEHTFPYEEWASDGSYATPCTADTYGYFTIPTLKCATPVLTYFGGHLSCTCETEGVYYVYNIVPSSMSGMSTDGEIDLDVSMRVYVHASREGYISSDNAYIDLNLQNVGDYNGDSNLDIRDVVQMIDFLLGSN